MKRDEPYTLTDQDRPTDSAGRRRENEWMPRIEAFYWQELMLQSPRPLSLREVPSPRPHRANRTEAGDDPLMSWGRDQLLSLSPKVLYIKALIAVSKACLQPSWGRIQQQSEEDYEALARLMSGKAMRHGQVLHDGTSRRHEVLEVLDGFVEQIEGDIAFVTLRSESGEALYGEYPASDLEARGIREHRHFICRTIDTGDGVKIELSAVPEHHLTEEQERAIKREIEQAFGDGDGPTDDY